MDAVETINKNGYTARIEYDDPADSPRDWDHMGTMVSWHRNKTVGDRDGIREGLDPAEFTAELSEQGALIVPVYMYSHSGDTIRTTPFGDRWDSGQVGIIFATAYEIVKELGSDTPETREQARKYLVGEVDIYNQWLSGDVYGYVIENDKGEHVDSCWGFYGIEDVRREVEERLADLPPISTDDGTRTGQDMVEIASATCGLCHRPIKADLNESSSLDWGNDGDYGCDRNPLNDDDGTGGHVPADPRAVLLTQEVQGAWHLGNKGPEYVEDARKLAQRLGIAT